jgi:hypothetical protein
MACIEGGAQARLTTAPSGNPSGSLDDACVLCGNLRGGVDRADVGARIWIDVETKRPSRVEDKIVGKGGMVAGLCGAEQKIGNAVSGGTGCSSCASRMAEDSDGLNPPTVTRLSTAKYLWLSTGRLVI